MIFSTEVSTETSFCDCIVGIFESQLGSWDTVTAIGNIGERSAVNQGWCVFPGFELSLDGWRL